MKGLSLTNKYCIVALMVGAAIARLLPHLPNAAPITAVALLSGATISLPGALLVPLGSMLLADVFLGFASPGVTVSVYASFALIVLLGSLLRKKLGAGRLIAASIGSSFLFYILTNAAVWWFSGMYPHTAGGLVLSYVYALPFFRNTLFGDLGYTTSLFLGFAYGPSLVRGIVYRLQTVSKRVLAPTE